MHHSGIPGTRYYYVKHSINQVLFNDVWAKLTEPQGDIVTDEYTSRAQIYCRYRIANIDQVEENEVGDEEDNEEEDNDDQREKVLFPHDVWWLIAPILGCFMTQSA